MRSQPWSEPPIAASRLDRADQTRRRGGDRPRGADRGEFDHRRRGPRHRLRRRGGRALLRARRARQRRRASRRGGRELRVRRTLRPVERAVSAPSCPRPGSATATTRRTSRFRGCSRAAATACWSTTTRPSITVSRRERADAWSVEVTGAPAGVPAAPAPARLALRVFAGPAPAEVLRRFSARIGRQPRVASAVGLRAVVPARRRSLDEQQAQLEKLRAADAPVSVAQTYLHYLPCGGSRAVEPERTTGDARPRRGSHDLLQPDALRRLSAGVRPRRCRRGALMRTAAGDPYIYQYVTSRAFQRRPIRLHYPAGRAVLYRRAAARGDRRRPRRLDGGLRRVHAARQLHARRARRDTRRTTAIRSTTTVPRTRWRAASGRRSCASSARAGPARRAARRWYGAAIRPRNGGSTALPRWSRPGSEWASPASARGAPTSAGSSGFSAST